MNCKNSSFWRAYLDGEVVREIRSSAKTHLQSCSACSRTVENLRKYDAFVSRLAPSESPDASLAWTKFQTMISGDRQSLWEKSSLSPRVKALTVVLGALVVLAVSLSFPALRSVAEDLLQIFRVERFEAVKIKPGQFGQMSSVDQDAFEELVKVEAHPEPKVFKSLDEAREWAKIEVKEPAYLPVGLTTDEIIVTSKGRASLSFDREKMGELAAKFGVSPPDIPEDLDGVKVTANLPEGVIMIYRRASGQEAQPILFVQQGGKPSLEVPAKADSEQVRQALLNLPFIPPDFRKALESVENWRETLPIPIPEGEGKSEKVLVSGVEGILISGPDNTQSLIWAKWEKIFIVASYGNYVTRQELFSVANSL